MSVKKIVKTGTLVRVKENLPFWKSGSVYEFVQHADGVYTVTNERGRWYYSPVEIYYDGIFLIKSEQHVG